jgi:glutaredoxin
MPDVLIYTTKICPNCKTLKQLLDQKNITYKEEDMATPAALTELRMKGVFTMAAPVLQVGSKFHIYKDISTGDKIDHIKVEQILSR